MIELHPKLLARVARVTRESSLLHRKGFRRERRLVVRDLREKGLVESEIARMLGVTVQYLGREFPRKKGTT